MRTRYGLALGEKTAEEVKISLGSAYPVSVEKQMIVRGQDLEKGLPKSVKLTSSQVREALAPTLNTIVNAIKDIINDAPPELTADIAERGITLAGGGAMLAGFAKLVSAETKMPVTVAAEPLSTVVFGCAKLLASRELLERVKIAKWS